MADLLDRWAGQHGYQQAGRFAVGPGTFAGPPSGSGSDRPPDPALRGGPPLRAQLPALYPLRLATDDEPVRETPQATYQLALLVDRLT